VITDCDLTKDITADLDVEKKLGTPFIQASAQTQAQRILAKTNNRSAEWKVAGTYRPQTPDTEGTLPLLPNPTLHSKLEEIFGSASNPRHFTDAGAPFLFWEDIRFAHSHAARRRASCLPDMGFIRVLAANKPAARRLAAHFSQRRQLAARGSIPPTDIRANPQVTN
jgi:hypothetical protein